MDSRFRSRKWKLHSETARNADIAAATLIIVALSPWGKAAPDVFTILQWWATVRGVVLAAYSTANLIQKGITEDDDPADSVP